MLDLPGGSEETGIKLSVNGSSKPDIAKLICEFSLEQDLYMSDAFRLVLGTDGKLFDEPPIMAADEITVHIDVNGKKNDFVGFVTRVGVETSNGKLQFVVSGYDRGFKLTRKVNVRTWQNVTYEDVVKDVVSKAEADLEPKVDAPRHTLSHVFQACETDLDFLRRLAVQAGVDCWASGRTLNFAKRVSGDGEPVTVKMGETLRDVRVECNAAAHANKFTVRAYDPTTGEIITGSADSTELSSTAPAAGKTSKAAGNSTAFGSVEQLVTHAGVSSTDEATALAQSLLDSASTAGTSVSAVVSWTPSLVPGCRVSLEGIGNAFSGEYMPTSVQHLFDPEHGFLTKFRSGNRTKGPFDMAKPPGPVLGSQLVMAKVSNNNDEENLGRVKVTYHLSGEVESPWAPVVTMGSQVQFTPASGDTVLVGFLHHDVRRPVVLGVLFTKASPPPLSDAVSGGKTTKAQFAIPNGPKFLLEAKTDPDLTIEGKHVTVKSEDTIVLDGRNSVTVKGASGINLN